MRLILDTGPWVALHCRDDHYHEWAKSQFALYAGPFLTCEAVVAETCFLLDSDFHIYRRHGRKVIPLLTPPGRE